MIGRIARENTTDGIAVGAEQNSHLLRWTAIAGMGLAVLLVMVMLAQLLAFDVVSPPTLSSNLTDSQQALRPESPLAVTVAGFGAFPQQARLFRSDLDADGRPVGREQSIPVRLDAVDEHTWNVASVDGSPLLKTDGAYRLDVQVASPSAALPVPATRTFQREYRFTTVSAPRPVLPSAPLKPRWGEAVSVDWTAPMQSIEATVQPSAPIKTWIDERDPTRSWVLLGEGGQGLGAGGTTYDVTLTAGRSVDALNLQRPASFKVAVPARPRVIDAPAAPVVVKYGESFVLHASSPLVDAKLDAPSDLQVRTTVQNDEVRVFFDNLQQGQESWVALSSATSADGAPLADPVRVQIRTPEAFSAPAVVPEAESTRVDPGSKIVVTFAGPVADRAVAEQSVSVEPAIDGRWVWTGPDQIELTPAAKLPFFTDFTVTVRGGPDGPRSTEGGYLEQDVTSTFRTTTNKRIDVDLTRQRLHMMEDGKIISTIIVGTGVAGAETPLGTYEVLYKMEKTRMRGVNPSGHRYDLPDVPWVLPFLGDYAIHGNYWRSTFGTPGSNGCVGMSIPDAKRVYDWADVGTPVHIHL